MATKTTSLTILGNLKSALKISTTTDDQLLEKAIDRASSWIETQTNRKLKARKYNGLTGGAATLGTHGTTGVPDEDYLYFSGRTLDNGGDTLIEQYKGVYHLPQYPVQSNSVVTFGLHVLSLRDATGETWDTTSYVEWRDFIVEREKGKLILLSGAFVRDFRNYRITMSAGYQIGSAQPYVPDDPEQLCIELFRDIYRDRSNLQSETIGTWSRTFDTQKEKREIKDTLEKYSRISL
jgi:hypothetical protein